MYLVINCVHLTYTQMCNTFRNLLLYDSNTPGILPFMNIIYRGVLAHKKCYLLSIRFADMNVLSRKQLKL